MLFHKLRERIDWWSFQLINRRFRLFFNRKFISFISIHWFKTKKNQRFIKKKIFRIRQRTRCVIRHSCFQRTFRKWNKKWKHEKNIRKIAINNSNVQWFKKKSNFYLIIDYSTNKLTFYVMHRRYDRKRFD